MEYRTAANDPQPIGNSVCTQRPGDPCRVPLIPDPAVADVQSAFGPGCKTPEFELKVITNLLRMLSDSLANTVLLSSRRHPDPACSGGYRTAGQVMMNGRQCTGCHAARWSYYTMTRVFPTSMVLKRTASAIASRAGSVVEVSDTGHGMSAETRQLGIVAQHKAGLRWTVLRTRVQPRCSFRQCCCLFGSAGRDEAVRRGMETILLVEDEPYRLRRLA